MGESQSFLTFEKEADRPNGQHGCAFGEDTEGKVFGYQIYENAQQVEDFKTAREEKMKAAGMSASDSASATGTILYAKCSKALFDVFPGGADVRNLVGGGIDPLSGPFPTCLLAITL